jgi:peptidoglycan-N-acetylglucosamine deacetylase
LTLLRLHSARLTPIAAVLFAIAVFALPALSQNAGAQRARAPVGTAGCGPTAIGLARTVEIKTDKGPRFGHQQYKENDFLADGEVVLTFDDGPSNIFTPQIIKTLEAHCTKATFFMVGSRALAEPRIVKDIASRGHTIGTHTWSHANLRAIGAVRAKDEIELGFSAVQRAAGRPIAPFFRFPYLADSRAMMMHLESRNIANFSIDADAYDYKTLNPAEVHRAIISQMTAKRKGIILFHDIQASTAHALNALLTDLKAKGFRVVHMVPATSATTVASYDATANRDAGRKQGELAANPLARRAVTWPLAAIQPPLDAPPPAPLPPAVQSQPLPPIAPARPRPAEDDWRTRIFRQ